MSGKSKFSEAQKREAIWEGLEAECLACVCCRHGITSGTWYKWRKELGLTTHSRRDYLKLQLNEAAERISALKANLERYFPSNQ